ncbi:unnamed protein product [Chironomus riparius]|uniref:Peptidase S1 domain-containing protein n=1 Tax=Chironomus riparius TaxID=315576 RepID=A0A9N9WXN4_9DIPT|nr:unnamed protein product [Chironomus riparius]
MLKFIFVFLFFLTINGAPTKKFYDTISYAKQSDSPWTVLIKLGADERRCTGSLIHKEYVITAAHCFDNLEMDYEKLEEFIKINIGDWKPDTDPDCDDADDDDDDAEICSDHHYADIPPKAIYIHDDYKNHDIRFDVAMIKLSRPPRLSPYITLIPLSTDTDEQTYEEGTMIITGFGEDKPKQPTKQKKQTEVTLIEYRKCKTELGASYTAEHHFCASVPDGITTCSGDSGGPVTSFDNGVYKLQGIVGAGNTDCVGSDRPSRILKIEPLIPWIEQTIRGESHTLTTPSTTTTTEEEEECDDLVC